MDSILQSIILGITQGLTEFIPISSTAHLRIIPSLLGWQDPGTEISAIIQLGTVLSVLCFFWKDLLKIYSAFVRESLSFVLGKTNKFVTSQDAKLGFWILVATLPISIIGLIFKEPLEAGMFRGLNIISAALVFFGGLLFISEMIGKQKKTILQITFKDVFLIGIAQAFALIPGASRSGVTILAALFLGLKRSDAARFSFLLGIPAIVASGMLELFTLVNYVNNGSSYICLMVGILSAFISGYWSIGFLIKYLQNNRTHIFVVYRIVLGLVIFYLSMAGLIR